MKALLILAAGLALASAASAPPVRELATPACTDVPRTSSCQLSGDPHFITFDNTYHDFMGIGWWALVDGNFLKFQYQTQQCGAVAHKVSCMRRAQVHVIDPDNPDAFVKVAWGTWPGQREENITIAQSGQDTQYVLPSRFGRPMTVLGGAMTLSWIQSSRQLQLAWTKQTGTKYGPVIKLGTYFGVVTVPREFYPSGDDLACGNPWLYSYGTCGFFSNSASDDFSISNGTVYVTNAVSGRRYNSPSFPINQWASNFAVDGINFEPIFQSHEIHLMSTPQNEIPTDADSAAAQQTTFANVEAMRTAADMCAAQNGDAAVFENCMYDAAAAPTFDVALSNIAAAAAAAEAPEPSSGLTDAAKIGIALGVVGFVAIVAIVVAFVMYRRSVDAEAKQALVLYDAKHPNNVRNSGAVPEGTVMDQL